MAEKNQVEVYLKAKVDGLVDQLAGRIADLEPDGLTSRLVAEKEDMIRALKATIRSDQKFPDVLWQDYEVPPPLDQSDEQALRDALLLERERTAMLCYHVESVLGPRIRYLEAALKVEEMAKKSAPVKGELRKEQNALSNHISVTDLATEVEGGKLTIGVDSANIGNEDLLVHEFVAAAAEAAGSITCFVDKCDQSIDLMIAIKPNATQFALLTLIDEQTGDECECMLDLCRHSIVAQTMDKGLTISEINIENLDQGWSKVKLRAEAQSGDGRWGVGLAIGYVEPDFTASGGMTDRGFRFSDFLICPQGTEQ